MSISFHNPFFDELANYPIRFSTPVFFGDSPYSSFSVPLNNGTGTLLKLRNKYLGVTCEHVLRAYRQIRRAQTVFQFGAVILDPNEHLISESREHDVAVLDLSSFVGKESGLCPANFVEPRTWPPRSVSCKDVVGLCGFPGVWREQLNLGHLRFYSFSSGAAEVYSVGQHHLMTRVDIDKCKVEVKEGLVLGSLGGLSGGPVFAWRKGAVLTSELVGFVHEYNEQYDLMRVTAANVIREDATLA